MKTFKKMLPIIFTLASITVMFVITSMSASAETYSGECGDNANWSFDTKTGILEISGTGIMFDYELTYIEPDNWYITTPWWKHKNDIKEIVIGDQIENISYAAFAYCEFAESVQIGDSVKIISDIAFWQCNSLKNINIPDSVQHIEWDAFGNCTNLEEFVVESKNNYYSSENGVLFNKDKTILLQYPCKKAEYQYDVPNSVYEIYGEAFKWCEFIKEVYIPTSVKMILYHAFYNSSVEEIYYYGTQEQWMNVLKDDICTSDVEIHYIPRYSGTCGEGVVWTLDTYTGILDISGIGEMNDYFLYENPWYPYRSYIQEVHIGDSVRSIGSFAFYGCTSFKSVNIGNSVTKIGPWAFYQCTSLSDIYIPDSVTDIKTEAFSECSSLKSIIISDSVTVIQSGAFFDTAYYNDTTNWKNNVLYISNHLIKAKNTLPGEYAIKDGTVCIADSAFSGCQSLESVNIPDSVVTIGRSSFYGCISLTHIIIPNSVISIDNYAFSGCISLISVTLPDSVVNVGDSAFVDCTSLVEIIVEEDNPAYTSIDGILYDEDITNLIQYPVGNSRDTFVVPDSVINISSYAFNGCAFLETIDIGISVAHIGDGAFSNCHSLISATIPTSVISIGENAFHYYHSTYYRYYKLNVIFICYENSYVHTYAVDNGFEYELISNCSYTYYISDNNATCSEDGTKTAYCDCGCGTTDTVTDIGSVLGHAFTNYVSDRNATCIENGTKTAKCDRCDVTDTVEDTGSMLGHSFGEWIVVEQSTYDSLGLEERKCSVCSVTEQKAIPEQEYTNPFTDIKESYWFYDSIEFVVKKGYMKGMSATKFSPNSNITREQFVLILANIAGVDTNEFKGVSSGFTDVPTGKWYSGAVTWAVNEGYVSGMSADKFGRGQSINRAALARMLYNYAVNNCIDTTGRADLSAFGDAKEFDKAGNAWMKESVQWAVDAGIISGMTVDGVNCVNPKGTATRAQAARMLMQFGALLSD